MPHTNCTLRQSIANTPAPPCPNDAAGVRASGLEVGGKGVRAPAGQGDGGSGRGVRDRQEAVEVLGSPPQVPARDQSDGSPQEAAWPRLSRPTPGPMRSTYCAAGPPTRSRY
eukprot:1696695-Rhodomonas_salina.1